MIRKKIVCVKADQRILDLWEKSIRECSSGIDPVVLDKQPDTVIDLFRHLHDLLEAEDDQIVYSLPVMVVHNLEFLERLESFDFVGFKEAGSPSINLGFFAATKRGLARILEAVKTFEFDDRTAIDVNTTLLILSTLGNKAELKLNKNDFMHTVDASLGGKGHVVTFCGCAQIMEMIDQSKLNIADIMENIMMNVSSARKEVQYRK